MASFSEIVGNFIFLGLFIFAGIGFIIGIQSDNNSVDPLIENSLFNDSYGPLQDSLSSLEETSDTLYDEFNEEQPKTGFGSIVLFSIVSVGKTFGDVTIGLFLAIIKIPLIVLGIPQTLLSGLVTWLIVSLLVAAWILYKLGG